MAKASKKSAPKKAKKAAPKAKPAAKAKPAKVKAVNPKKVEKPKAVKKVEPAKPVAKKVEAKAAKVKKVSEPKKPLDPTNPNLQLNIFPIINQRPIAHKPKGGAVINDDKTRYSDEELKWFEDLITKKMNKAKDEFKILKDTLNRTNDEGTDSTSGGNTKVLEDGAETAEKENLSQLAARQLKYITNLENALVRIKNRTYGICTVTGKLIPKDRLIAVPHTTQSIEAKMMKKD